ncbi:antibiotic biosynthesis monooxygenase family protein [Malaciobacter sp. WC5094]|uniref:antibiotic biosynthesis monooxygenase family protein n=1 Tax=Arcobacter sp. YIC-80 TaxID=3376683 RepID=UPI00384B1DEC
MIIVVFRFHLMPNADLEKFATLSEKMGKIVSKMPGFLGVKDFSAQDGEIVVIAEFDSLESVDEWKSHPQHQAVQKLGKEKFFADYQIQVCDLIRSQEFKV